MKISNSMIHNLGGFELDAGAIKLQSIDCSNIKLPYAGQLPDGVSADSAYIALNVMPAHSKAVLVCKSAGKDKRFALDYTAAEVKELLDKFFFKEGGGTRFDTGLDLYWQGLWTAHYIDWKRAEAA